MLEINKIYNENCLDTMKRIPDNYIDLIVCSPPYDCYSDDTEILTDSGWKYIKDVTLDEKVITLNPDTKEMTYQKVIRTYNYKFDGNLLNFKNQDIDLAVTENHNMYITGEKGQKIGNKQNKKELNWLRSAKNINKSGYMPYNGYVWKGVDNDTFILPSVDCLYNRQQKYYPEKTIDMIWWVRFLGIYLAEGSCRNTKNKSKKIKVYEISIKQKELPFVNLIRNIFDNLPFTYRERKERDLTIFSITDRQLWDYLYKLGNSFEKYIPYEIKQLDSKYIQELLLYLFIGDGSKRVNFNYTNFDLDSFLSYKSHSDFLKNDIQECLLKIGRLSNIHKNHLISNKHYSYIKYAGMKVSDYRYTGNVVCVEVEKYNIIYVRRNGKAIWCGNCLRKYETGIGLEWSFEAFKPIAKELSRVIKQGRCIVWIVGDESINGSESLSSFKQAIYFKEECGLNAHDTMIYAKKGFAFPSKNRYNQIFEYMFVFSKGKPEVFNPIKDRKNKWTKRWSSKASETMKDGNKKIRVKPVEYGEYGMRTNIWEYHTNAGNVNPEWDILKGHPAIMNIDIAKDHILSWSNEGDLVYDPFMGSGTTAKASVILRRNYIGSEVSGVYMDIISKRLSNAQIEMF